MATEHMNIVFVGHVDHGKSTLVGRLLAEAGALPEGKLEKLQRYCERNAKPFEYAFLLDALSDEQSQGITIDIARCFFKTDKRKYLILDAPGHIEFLKNLVTGAANAEAAFLVIDAHEGIQENSRRHAYMLSLLNVKQVIILINKIDLIDYSEAQFNQVKHEFADYLSQIGIEPIAYIPVSGREGDNITELSNRSSWYQGNTVLAALDNFKKQDTDEKLPFRMHLQDVYKFTNGGDNRRIFAGQVSSGTLSIGDKIVVYPSGKKSTIKTIESFNSLPQKAVTAGYSTGFTLHEQIYAKRGDVIVIEKETPPKTASTIKVSLFWLGIKPLSLNKTYYLKLGTSKTKVVVEKILNVLDTSSLAMSETAREIRTNQAAECILSLFMPITYDDLQTNPTMGRFVIVDEYDIAGGGIIQGHIDDDKTKLQAQLYQRNTHWVTGNISLEEREQALKQKSQLILITGDGPSEQRKMVAAQLERQLFSQNKFAYYIGIGNVKHALESANEQTNIADDVSFKRFSEVLNILLDTGLIIIATVANMTPVNLAELEMITSHLNVVTFWLGRPRQEIKDASFIEIDASATADILVKRIFSHIEHSITV